MFLFFLTVAGILVGSYQGWHDSRPNWEKPSKNRMSKRRWLIIATSIIAILLSTANSFSWLQQRLLPQRSVDTYLKLARIGPNCTAASLVVYPTGRIKDMHLTLDFSQPIKAHILQNGFNKDPQPEHPRKSPPERRHM